MTRYAHFDLATGRVVAWYDNDFSPSPPSNQRIAVTDDQWVSRVNSTNGWYVQSGTLTAYNTTPPQTVTERASIMLSEGIQIVSSATPSLNGTYPCSEASDQREAGILAAIVAGLSLPNGVAVVVDIAGTPHAFAPNDFKNYCQAKMTFKQALMTIMGNNTGSLPTLPVAIP